MSSSPFKKKVLIVGNCKIFLFNFVGYSIQMKYLFDIFDSLGFELGNYVLCYSLNNGNDPTHAYSYNDIMSFHKLELSTDPVLQKINYYSNQDGGNTINMPMLNKLCREQDYGLVIMLGDLLYFSSQKEKFEVPSMFWYPCHYLPMNTMDAHGLGFFDIILSLSPSIKVDIEKKFPDKKVYYLPHIYEDDAPKKFNKKELREKWELPTDRFIFYINASLYEDQNRKAIDNQILAFKKVYDKHPEAFLLIHSSCKKKNEAEVMIKQEFPMNIFLDLLKLGPEAVMWHTEILEKAELSEFYLLADVFSQCSKSEGFGIPIVEAQNYDLAVISTDFLSMKEHNMQNWTVPYATMEYNYYQDGRWAVPSTEGLFQMYEKILLTRNDPEVHAKIKLSNHRIKKLTDKNAITQKMIRIVTDIEKEAIKAASVSSATETVVCTAIETAN